MTDKDKSRPLKELYVEHMNKASPSTPEAAWDETMKFFGELTEGGKYSKVKSDEVAQMAATIKGLDESLRAAWRDAKEFKTISSEVKSELSHAEDARKELEDDLNQVLGAFTTIARAEEQIKTIQDKRSHP